MKLREIRESYEDTARTFSSSVRNLCLSGIAISWLFIDRDHTGCHSLFFIISIASFVITLFADIIQNYNLSTTWYKFYKGQIETGKSEDNEIDEPEDKNKWAWRIYDCKLFTLIIGYLFILLGLII